MLKEWASTRQDHRLVFTSAANPTANFWHDYRDAPARQDVRVLMPMLTWRRESLPAAVLRTLRAKYLELVLRLPT